MRTYGRAEAVDFFLDHGVEVDAGLRAHGDGHTGLHVAAYHAHLDVVDRLLRHGADVEAIDATWHTPPLIWALTGWERSRDDHRARFSPVIVRLVGAGANVTQELLDSDDVRADPAMQAALSRGRR